MKMAKTKLDVLLLEDNPTNVIFLRTALAEDVLADFNLVVVESLGQALEILSKQKFAVVLLDLGLADGQGLSNLLSLHHYVPDLPVVVLAALNDEGLAIQSIRAGAQDYLVKDQQGFLNAGRVVRFAVERQKSLMALREGEGRLKVFLDSVPDAMIIVNMAGKIIQSNIQAERLFGYEHDELQQVEVNRLVSEDFQSSHSENILKLFEQSQSRDVIYERFACHKDGHQFTVEISLNLQRLGPEPVLFFAIRETRQRKQAKPKLDVNQNLLRQMLESIPDSIFAVDWDYRLLNSNQRFQQELITSGGQPLELGKPVLSSDYPPEVLDYWQTAYSRALAGETFTSESSWIDVNGKLHAHENRFSPLRDEDGTILGTLVVAHDITNRKHAEESLRLQSAALNAAENEIIITDIQGTILWVNPAWSKVTGYTLDEALGKNPRIIKSGKHDQAFYKEMWDQILSGNTWTSEMINKRKDGTLFHEDVNISPVYDSQGRITHFVGVKQDITQRKQAEQKLRESEARSTAMLNAIPDMMFRLDREGVFLDFKADFTDLYVQSENNIIGRKIREILPPEVSELVEQKIQITLENNILQTFEYQLQIPDQGMQSYEARMVSSGMHEVIVIVRNITSRKLVEEQIRESESRFATIVMNSQVAISISLMRNEQIIQTNPAFVRLFGFSPEEISGNTTLGLGIWSNASEYQQFVETLTTQRNVQSTEITMRIRSGAERQVILWGELIEISGDPCILMQIVDITERKRAELMLSQRLEDLAFINTVTEAVNHSETIETFTELLAVETGRIFGTQAVSLYLLDPDQKSLILQHFTMGLEYIKKLEELTGRPLPQIELPLEEVDHFRKALNSEDGILVTGFASVCNWLMNFSNTRFLSRKARPLYRRIIPAAARMLSINSIISIPLNSGEDVLGLIEFTTEGVFDENTLRRLKNVRHQLAELILRKRAEQALRESNEKYRLLSEELEERIQQATAEVQDLYNNAPAGYHSLDAQGNFIQINQTELNWTGYTRDEVLGRSFGNFMAPQDRVVFEKEFLLFKERGFVNNVEIDMLRKDGTSFPALLNATVIYDKDGNYVMSRTTVFDNTERKLAELAVRESEETYRSLFETSNDAIFLLDAATKNYVRVNSRCLELLNVSSAEELIGRNAFDFIHPSQLPAAHERYLSLLRGDQISAYERTFVRADGTVVETEITLSLICNSEGTPKFIQSVVRDITLRKQAELAIRESEAQLRLSRDNLSAANAALEKAARMKDEFLASMSHELRTPLTGILGLSESILFNTYGALTEKQGNVIKTIETSAQHLLDLINDILDLSKIESGMLEMNIDAVSLGDVCQSSLQLIKGMAHKKGHSVAFSMEPPAILVRGDARRLKQMVVNLLSNAIKFTPSGGSLGLEVKGDVRENVVYLTVWDRGIGIAHEDLGKLFKPFVQLETSLSRQYEGTGLGLSLVQRMAVLHGGSVHVESTPGEGSRFTIVLPWSFNILQPTLPAEPGKQFKTVKKALLVADDENDSAQSTRYLQILGIEPIPHGTIDGVGDLVVSQKPHLVLLNLQSADHDGFDVLTALKKNPNTHDIPVVFCSAKENHSRAFMLGAAACLTKPLLFNELRDEIVGLDSKLELNSTSAKISDPPQMTVLIADDNEVLIETVSDFLELQNFRVFAVRSGLELLDGVAELHPDIILMDIQMPGMDGLETTRRVRAHPDRRVSEVPIIAVTALAMTGDRESCLAAGANEYLSKPVGLKDLAKTIHRLLQNNI